MSKFMEEFGLRIQDAIDYQNILLHPESFTATDVRQAELVLNDSYYSVLYSRVLNATGSHGSAVDAIAEAGCFDDRLDSRPTPDPWFLSGPYRSLFAPRYQQGKRNIALVGTGSYDPMHDGHITMMTATRDAILSTVPEANIVGAVMSSSHDSYVRRFKTPDGVDQHERVQRNQIFLEKHLANQEPWILHDNWETQGVSKAVNFTDVLNHIQAMMDTQVGPGVELVYVFGSDAQDFAGAFTHGLDGLATAAVVERPGYDIQEKNRNQPGVLVVPGGIDESSTRIRARQRNAFLIRGDGRKATAHLETVIPDYDQRISQFQDTIQKTFHDVFPSVEVLDVDRQIALTTEYLSKKHSGRTVISSDVYLPGVSQVRISRLFHLGTSQHHSDRMTPIPKPVDKNTPVVFVDDDIHTGFTLLHLRSQYTIDDFVSMSQIVRPGPYLDIVDERDFLIGAKHGGLMMEPDSIRYPYLAPFVNLTTRASVPPAQIRTVSAALWLANWNFYRDTDLNARDVGAEFVQHLGLRNESMERICSMFTERFTS